ncbi:uncharacterized protein LOC121382740 [Gigantopelta aegis]|uniref:uncharacterized protein LOC121382740 n=1 Tax=Gigantopelta aegis TaxID=1735272 RepID=UPI001B88B236|nr:uncharacterized protein LOC121382740 [Gigantopelta aegis]
MECVGRLCLLTAVFLVFSESVKTITGFTTDSYTKSESTTDHVLPVAQVPPGSVPLTAGSGVITSPGYPSPYPNRWHSSSFTSPRYLSSINVPEGVQYVEFRFVDFHIEACGGGNSMCHCDGLIIEHLGRRLCDNNPPGPGGIIRFVCKIQYDCNN